jgi:hypothetical protein
MTTMTTPGPCRTGRQLLGACGLATVTFAVAVTAVGTPAAAAPEEGVPTTSPTECAPVGWGWPNGSDGPAYFGQRFGAYLPPQCRGPVLEGLDA